MNKSQSKIRAIQNSNLVLESRYFNSKVTLSEQTSTWLPVTGDKYWEYQKKGDKWFARKKGSTQEYDLSSNDKYKSSVDKLESLYPGGKSPSQPVGTDQKVDNSGTLPSKEGEDVNVSKETPKGEEFVEPTFPEAKGD